MSVFKDNSYELNHFDSLKIGLASTEKILEWSHGEVSAAETINYRTLKPEPNGLFCEAIFGPQKDYECHCGKYKKIRFKGIVCDRCNVEVTKKNVRRERMGHIKLAAPISHIWYVKGIPSRIGLCLDVTPKNLEKVLYFAAYIVLEPGESGFAYKEIITENQYNEACKAYPTFRGGIGAEAIRELLCAIDLDAASRELHEEFDKATGQKKSKLVRRVEIIDAFRLSGNRPEWMVMEVLPVIPPDLRPMVQLDGGRFATSDLNDLYRRVINRNNRLNKLIQIMAPDIIVRNEKRMLQEAVDSLIDNGRRGRPVTGPGGRNLKSLSDMLKGKQGRFRQNLLGKRVDYSGRSVIVVGPELRFWQCGLPKMMALELFKPFISKRLVDEGLAHNIKNAGRMVDELKPEVWDALDDVIKEHPVMLNRAPTLHRLGIQAFEPVLVEGKAIKLHPLACTAFNADFDGDQMAVHVPLSTEAQAEARFLMLSVNNILAPKDGSPITTPTQDMILGSYYLTHPGTKERNTYAEKGDGKIFTDMDEMMMAYQTGEVGIHAKVKVRRYLDKNDKRGQLVESTVGRFIFNTPIPQDLGFVDRTRDPYALEFEDICTSKTLPAIIEKCFKKHGNTATALMLDGIKDQGYHYSTKAAVTISISDMEIPEAKKAIVAEAEERVNSVEASYDMGFLSDKERHNQICDIWQGTTGKVADAVMDNLDEQNNLYIMAKSGARGSKKQISQIGGMRGLMGNAKGETVEIPIKANFREGLSVLDYFVSTNGARKGLADTALRTADSGYLTRRLVDVSHTVIIRDYDCGSEEGIEVTAIWRGEKGQGEPLEKLSERIKGRIALRDVMDPDNPEKCIVAAGSEITDELADLIEKKGIESVAVRTVMGCQSRVGVCAMCYGRNLATGELVNIGEAVGIIAAQSIGEPGTQLTMRTFHTGGVAGGDITGGLPRVEELFEARKPKGNATIAQADGVVKSTDTVDKQTTLVVEEESGERVYIIPYGAKLVVKEGEQVKAGTNITAGPLDPQEIHRILGDDGVYQYILTEVQRVYRDQGVGINDKHIEVIISQMLSKYEIEDSKDTNLLPGSLYSRYEVEDENARIVAEGKSPAEYRRVLRGITKASLATQSFLSAASFQETTRILTDAAIRGKIDPLQGLKENVIIGKLIPAGTGMPEYQSVEIDYGDNKEYMDSFVVKPRVEQNFVEMTRADLINVDFGPDDDANDEEIVEE